MECVDWLTVATIIATAFPFFGLTILAVVFWVTLLDRHLHYRIALVGMSCGICLSLSNTAGATSVIVVRTPSTIYLGADSKIKSLDGSRQGTFCKIGISHDIFWGEAGIISDAITHFDSTSIVNNIMSQTSSISTRIADFENVTLLSLRNVLRSLRDSDPLNFVQKYGDRRVPAFQIVFAYFYNDAPRVIAIDFMTKLNNIGEPDIDVVEHNFDDIYFIFIGQHKAIEAEIAHNKSIWKDYGIPTAIRHLLQIEISAVPEDVGPPIALVEIDQNGASWISKGVCSPQ
jgi:hypothetical protein